MTTSGTPPHGSNHANFSFDFKPQDDPFETNDFRGHAHDQAVQSAIQNKGIPTLTARHLLDLPLPQMKLPETPGDPSPSSSKNILFWVPDNLLYDQYKDIFPTDLGGYRADKVIDETRKPVTEDDHPWPPRFYPDNEETGGQKLDIEAQVVHVGRKFILGPVTAIMRRKIQGIKYNVEGLITGCVPQGRFKDSRKYQDLAGYVDAVWATHDDEPFAFCEFKRWGVLRDDHWRQHGNEFLEQDPNKTVYLSLDAQHVLQQVVKYAWCTNRLYFMVCDWSRILFLRFPKELPLEAFTYYWRDGPIPQGEVIPNQQQPVMSRGRSKAFTGGTSYYPDGPIQAVMSTNMALFKMQVQAFICQSYEHRNDARRPFDDRKLQERAGGKLPIRERLTERLASAFSSSPSGKKRAP